MLDEEKPVFFNTAQAAAYCGMSKGTFDRYRLRGEGPKYHRIGRKTVRYLKEDLDEWLQKSRVTPFAR